MRSLSRAPVTAMRLLRVTEPFDNPDWIFEPKIDGFRALAHVNGHHCTLLSRNGNVYKSWPQLAEEIAHSSAPTARSLTVKSAAWSGTAPAVSRTCCSSRLALLPCLRSVGGQWRRSALTAAPLPQARVEAHHAAHREPAAIYGAHPDAGRRSVSRGVRARLGRHRREVGAR